MKGQVEVFGRTFEIIRPEAREKRGPRTVDIVKRLGVLTPDKVHMKNYPIDHPTTVFNPTMLIEGETVRLFARVIIGFYTYTSAIALITIPIPDARTTGALGH